MANKKAEKRERKSMLDDEAAALKRSRTRLVGIVLVAFLLLAFGLSGALRQASLATPTAVQTWTLTPTTASTAAATTTSTPTSTPTASQMPTTTPTSV